METTATGPEPSPSSEPEPGTGDILVVDDNTANLTAIQAALGDFDGTVVRAESGSEALGQLLARDFALILLDVKMPSMNGLETARMIRGRKRSRHTPIMFITAYDRDDVEVLEAYKLGAVDFLFKPLVAEVLQAKVAVFVDLQRRTAKIERQAALLREHERREYERALESERRRWEGESLRRQMEELEAADRRKDKFLALLGHELRNPLTPIVTGLALLRETLPPDSISGTGAVRACEMMQRQAKHVTRLVDDLLDVSRINSGKIELRKTLVSIKDVVEDALNTSRPFIDERQHEVRLALPTRPLLVRGDAVRLVQALANLLNNAARYTEPGGLIRVEGKEEQGFVELGVADTGRGIAPEFLPRVFDMFAQERDALGAGLGLGLTLAAQLADLHGGTLEAFSDGPGRGSRFVLRLPLEQTEENAPNSRRSRPPVRGGSKALVVALVDDQSDIRDLMQELLATWGHAVEVAENGESGIALILGLRPDIAFVDIGLPDMDGYEVVARVRKGFRGPLPRLVAVTGFGRDADRRMALEAGFDAHLVKPVDMDALKKVLSFEEAT